MDMRKLNQEQLSRVLSEHAVGNMDHMDYTRCVAAVSLDHESGRFWDVSWEVSQAHFRMDDRGFGDCSQPGYPEDTDTMLRLLETAGLA